MKRAMVAAVISVCALFTIAFNVTAAGAETGYSDGSQCQGGLCPGGPPPVDPSWAPGQECKVDRIDPQSFVYVTEHFVYGTTPPPAGVVPVTSDAHAVFPYSATPPHLDPVNVEAFVAGKQGFRADTWNIGVGVTNWVPFNCTVPETTTTTTTTVAPTTTTTTVAPTTTTVAPTTTTAAVVPPGPNPNPPAPAPEPLPNTGSPSGPLAAIGIAAVASGIALVYGAKRRAARSN